jgi:hypothetical protein
LVLNGGGGGHVLDLAMGADRARAGQAGDLLIRLPAAPRAAGASQPDIQAIERVSE